MDLVAVLSGTSVDMRDRRTLYSDATAAAARIRGADSAEASLVATLVHAVCIEKGQAKRRRFWAARLLASLTRDHKEIRDAVRKLAVDDEWHIRYRAMRCLDVDTLQPFGVEILRRGIQDDHPQVRSLAACMAGSLVLTELVEDIDHYVRTFPVESSWIGSYWLPLLRNGYVLDCRSADPLLLCVVHGRKVITRFITPDDLANGGVDTIVAEMGSDG